ncbi:jg5789 [Pararge aegeria aegeria]|uniref:Jg5789 protein n=1 Tax=Pararge aegeria aegeria TaxID=348720 RepID=A0A8S4R486_9NEOP|nr:jg5789 [Pararge aegeria aegeria]
MECGTTDYCRKRGVQAKEKSNREDLKTDIQHRKETYYREVPSDGDSAMSSAPASLSPQPLNEMWVSIYFALIPTCINCFVGLSMIKSRVG